MKTTPRAGGAALSALTLVASTIILADSAGARSSASTTSTAMPVSTMIGHGPAVPAPYTVNASVSVSTSRPAQGARLTVSGKRFKPGERVKVSIDVRSNRTYRRGMLLQTLDTVRTGPSGGFSTSVRLPRKATCTHSIVAKGLWSKRVATTKITIGRCG